MKQIIRAAGEGLHLDTARLSSKTGRMNLRRFEKYRLWRDTSRHGEFSALCRLLTPMAGNSIRIGNETKSLA
jgi:hypothetical protein